MGRRVPKPILRLMSRVHVPLYRVTGGRFGGRVGAAPILLLTTIGHRSGKERTAPLLYLKDGHDLVVVGSQGGHSTHPLWYRNLMANPEAHVTIGRDHTVIHARPATDTEVERLWPQLLAIYPAWEDYRARTTRRFPIMILASPVR